MSTTVIRHGYALSRQEAVRLSSPLERSRPHNQKRFDIWLLPGQGALSPLAEAVEGWVMEGRYGHTPDERAESWRAFGHRSWSILACGSDDCQGEGYRPVGVIRLTSGAVAKQMKSPFYFREKWGDQAFQALEEKFQPVWTRTWAIDTLAVDPAIKAEGVGRLVVHGMIKFLYDLVHANDIGWLIGIMENHIFRKMNRMGLGLKPIGDSKLHLQAMCTPFLLVLADLQASLDQHPEYADMFRYGRGPGELSFDQIFNFPDLRVRI